MKDKYACVSPRQKSPADASNEDELFKSPKVQAAMEYRAARTTGKRSGMVSSMNSSIGKYKTQQRYNKRNFIPSTSGTDTDAILNA